MRTQLHRVAQMLRSFVILSETPQGQAQVDFETRLLRGQPERLAKFDKGSGEVFFLCQQRAEVISQISATRRQADSLAHGRNRLVELALRAQDTSQSAVRFGLARRQPDRLPQLG